MVKSACLHFSGTLFMKCAGPDSARNMLTEAPTNFMRGGSIPKGDVVFFTHTNDAALQAFAQTHPGAPALLNPGIQRESTALIRAMQLATNWIAVGKEARLNHTLN